MQEVPPHDQTEDAASTRRYGAPGDADLTASQARAHRLRRAWRRSLDPGRRSALLSWTSFTVTFASVRALTHWIKAGHGPSGGGMSLDGKHFHHYTIGIAMLGGIGAVAVRGAEHHRCHPLTAVTIIGAGGVAIAGTTFWPEARRALR